MADRLSRDVGWMSQLFRRVLRCWVFLFPSRPTTFLKLAIEDLKREWLGGHADYMPHPTQVSLGKEHLDAGCRCS